MVEQTDPPLGLLFDCVIHSNSLLIKGKGSIDVGCAAVNKF